MTVLGPKGTPYEGGKFILNINFCHQYPFKPPKLLLKTKMLHPNFDHNTGHVCLRTLDLVDQWLPSYNYKEIVKRFLGIMKNPDLEDFCHNFSVLKLYLDDKNVFDKLAAEFTDEYAKGN